jgi:uncharacterized RmlC-like cupin family protein
MTTQPRPRWKHDGVCVVGADQLDTNTAQTPGMDRKAAINFARTGVQKLWAGTVHIRPDAKTGARHHGAMESVFFLVKGRARMRWLCHSRKRAGVHRRSGPGRFHSRAALNATPIAAPSNQRQRHRSVAVRAGAQRRRSGGG